MIYFRNLESHQKGKNELFATVAFSMFLLVASVNAKNNAISANTKSDYGLEASEMQRRQGVDVDER